MRVLDLDGGPALDVVAASEHGYALALDGKAEFTRSGPVTLTAA